jgi:hypothetical protein
MIMQVLKLIEYLICLSVNSCLTFINNQIFEVEQG